MKWVTGRRRYLFAGSICLLAGGVYLLLEMADRRRDARAEAEIDQIVALVVLPQEHQDRFDAVRQFVNRHSVHAVDQEFRALQEQKGFAQAILAHANGKRQSPVPMECSTRSNLMGKMLRKLGYKTRIVAIYDNETNRSHSFLEVLNPSGGQWETQDPDYDLYWRDAVSQARVSAAERAADIALLEPCRTECGWEAVPRAKRLLTYFDTIVIKDKAAGTEEVRRIRSGQ